MQVGTSELLDAFAALQEIPWQEPGPFREAMAATLAKSPDDHRTFDLVFERYFFRAVEQQALDRGVREAGAADDEHDGMTGGENLDFDALRQQVMQAVREANEAA